jgi:hypothetical protein
MPEEIHRDAIARTGVLVKDINDDCSAGQQVEDGVQRAAFGKRAESSAPELFVTRSLTQRGLKGRRTKWNRP